MDRNQSNGFGKVKASPAARRLARELDINLEEIKGSGIEGRIQLGDVERYHAQLEEFAAREAAHLEEKPVEEILKTKPTAAEIDNLDEILEQIKTDAEPVVEQPQAQETKETIDAQEPDSLDLVAAEPVSVDEEVAEIEEESVENETAQEEEETSAAMDEPVVVDEEFSVAEELIEEEESQEEEEELEEACEEESCCCPHCAQDGDFEDWDELDELDDMEYEIPPMPVYTSFTVPDESIRSLLSGMYVGMQKGLMDVVVKACCCALKKVNSLVYEGRVNVVAIDGEDFDVRTAVNAHEGKVSAIVYEEADEEDGVMINLWDMTAYPFKSFQKVDVDTINLFVLWDGERITVDFSGDEYVMDIIDAVQFMEQFRKYLVSPAHMLL